MRREQRKQNFPPPPKAAGGGGDVKLTSGRRSAHWLVAFCAEKQWLTRRGSCMFRSLAVVVVVASGGS